MKISVVIPTLNEELVIEECLSYLQDLRHNHHEVIVVDGGSTDRTVAIAGPLADRIVTGPRGRAGQMNAGAAVAQGDVLIFLHADSLVQFDIAQVLSEAVTADLVWGRFDIRLSGDHFLLRMIERLINIRSRLTGIATGDQAIYVTRKLFDRVTGFPDIELMEDIALCKNLKQYGWPVCLPDKLVTSSRRWEEKGILRTVLQMWFLRFRYFLGTSPAVLAKQYD